MCQDCQITIKKVADIINVSFETVQAILTSDLNMHCVAATFMPRLLTHKQKQHRVDDCQDICQQVRVDPTFMSRFITGDESWVYGSDPETKQLSSQWKSPHSPRLKVVRQVTSATQDQTVKAKFYCNILRCLREDIRCKCPELWCDDN